MMSANLFNFYSCLSDQLNVLELKIWQLMNINVAIINIANKRYPRFKMSDDSIRDSIAQVSSEQ